MRNPNGYGSVFKLSGNRRKPFAVRITKEWTDEGKRIYKYLSYHITRKEAMQALASYNAGLGNILKAQKLSGNQRKWNDIKKYLSNITGRNSLETINYVASIKGYVLQVKK